MIRFWEIQVQNVRWMGNITVSLGNTQPDQQPAADWRRMDGVVVSARWR